LDGIERTISPRLGRGTYRAFGLENGFTGLPRPGARRRAPHWHGSIASGVSRFDEA
jgi:hypothetical protein